MSVEIRISTDTADEAREELARLVGHFTGEVHVHTGAPEGKAVGGSEESPSASPPASAPSESESESEAPVSKTTKKKASKKKASKKKTAKKTETPEPEGNGEVSLDDVMAMGKKVHATFGMNTIRDLIESHGGENLSSIPPENRASFMEACQAQLDQGE